MPSVFGFHFTSPTNDINVVFAFSIMVLVLTYIVGIGRNGLGHFAHFFKPFKVFLPLNLIEEIAIKQNNVLGLLVDFENPNAKKLYEKKGFTVVGEKMLMNENHEHMQYHP